MKKRVIALILAAALLGVCGCGGAGEESAAQTPAGTGEETAGEAPGAGETGGGAIDRFVVGTTADIESAVRQEDYNYDMLSSAVADIPLVYQDTDGIYHPLVASWETEDSVTWTYTIQEGMTWSDGESVTAEDILYTLQYEDAGGSANLTEQTDSEGNTTAAKYTGYTLSEDGRSISLTLAAANVRELSNMTSFRILPSHIYRGAETVSEDGQRISCGPYTLSEFNREAGTLTFVRNPYYPAQPNVETVVYQTFSNEDTMYMALQSGDIQMVWAYNAGVSATYQDVLAGLDSVSMMNVTAANVPAVLAFNNAKGVFTDANIRRAVSYALDYEAFRTYFGSDAARIPNRGFVPPATVGYKETEQLTTDPEKAAQALAEAGYTEKNADGFYVDAQGKPLGFTLTVNGDKTNQVGYADLIKTQLEAFGIQVTLDTVDGATYNAKTSNKFSGNNVTMEAAVFGYTAAGVGMMNGLASIYVDGNHAVQGGCQVFDEEFQAILGDMSAAGSLEAYTEAAGRLQDYYAQETPFIALCWDSMVYAWSAQYDNLTADQTFGLNNVNTWFTITRK